MSAIDSKLLKLAQKIDRELELLSRVKLHRAKKIRPIRILSRADKLLREVAKVYAQFCKDRKLCRDLLLTLFQRYRSEDIIQWVEDVILSGKDLQLELEKIVNPREVSTYSRRYIKVYRLQRLVGRLLHAIKRRHSLKRQKEQKSSD